MTPTIKGYIFRQDFGSPDKPYYRKYLNGYTAIKQRAHIYSMETICDLTKINRPWGHKTVGHWIAIYEE